MTEREWPGSADPSAMLNLLRSRNAGRSNAGKRKLRLVQAACMRRHRDQLFGAGPGRKLLDLVEQIAEGRLRDDEVQPALDPDPRLWEEDFAAKFYSLWSVIRSLGLPGAVDSTIYLLWCLVDFAGRQAVAAGGPSAEPGRSYSQTKAAGEERLRQAEVVRDVFGDPFRPLPRRRFPPEVRGLARACDEGDEAAYAVLADALAELGEDQAAAHCRQGGHVKGCHVVEWVLGK